MKQNYLASTMFDIIKMNIIDYLRVDKNFPGYFKCFFTDSNFRETTGAQQMLAKETKKPEKEAVESKEDTKEETKVSPTTVEVFYEYLAHFF